MKLGKATERDTGQYGKLKEVEVDGKKVAFWEKTWGDKYPFLVEGLEIEFDLVEKEKNGFKNITAYPRKDASTGTTARSGGGFIAKAQEKKAEFITKAQDNKNESIKIASTMSMAVNCALAEFNSLTEKSPSLLASLIEKWRKWLWFAWDNWEDYPPFLSPSEELPPDEAYEQM